MPLEQLLDKATRIAIAAHLDQFDKAGRPYIEHPVRVMEKMETLEEKIVAILHDAVEDSELTIEHLINEGFPPNIIRAINSLTRKQDEKYSCYLKRVMRDRLALAVKVEDMRDNMNFSRIKNPTPEDYSRQAKYERNLPKLVAKLALFKLTEKEVVVCE